MWLPPALLLLSLPGCFSIRGPASVRGREQGSLTVQCRYDPKWKNYVKWWCKGAVWSSCQILVKTTESEWEKDRVSIRDNQRSHIFTVTMKELRRDDADTYWCGIERSGVDLAVQVVVIIDPEGTVVTSSENLLSRTIANSHGGLSSGSNVSPTEIPSPKVFTSNLGPPSSLPVTTWPSMTRQETPDPSQHPRSFLSNVRFLLLVFLELPLLLSMVSAVLWVNRPQKSSGRRCNQPDYEKQ
ncbi:CD300c molecule [Rhinolophus ferrumequinum]|uniref:CD300c molecule n=1 Tax=Rhinolophus ferrumequinum TaxID=59479 RepID=A0A7J7TCE3_RHIFE|nr:CD300c molecule [Rhinolophus ferrumequinum]